MGISADAKPHIETRPRTGGGDAYDHGDKRKSTGDASKNQMKIFFKNKSYFRPFDRENLWFCVSNLKMLGFEAKPLSCHQLKESLIIRAFDEVSDYGTTWPNWEVFWKNKLQSF